MRSESFRQALADYMLSGHAYLHCPTTEKTRFLAELKQLAESLPDGGRRVFTWSQATGWRDAEGNPAAPPSGVQFEQPDAQKVAQEVLDLPEEAVFVVRDFGCYLQHRTYPYADVVVAWLGEARDVQPGENGTCFGYVRLFGMPEMGEYGTIESENLREKAQGLPNDAALADGPAREVQP